MRTFTSHLLCMGAVLGLLTACDDSATMPLVVDAGLDSGSDSPQGPTVVVDAGAIPGKPSVVIVSPADNAAVSVQQTKRIPVNFTTDFTIKAPGKCAGQPDCGHIYVLVDGSNCDAAGKSYNTLATASPTIADLNRCNMGTGKHTISLELRHDDGTRVTNQYGLAVVAQVQITAQ